MPSPTRSGGPRWARALTLPPFPRCILRRRIWRRCPACALPCLRLAMDCARRGGTSSAILSAANEVAVSLFLGHRLGFNSIYDCVDAALQSIKIVSSPTLEEILEADGAARRFVRERFS